MFTLTDPLTRTDVAQETSVLIDAVSRGFREKEESLEPGESNRSVSCEAARP